MLKIYYLKIEESMTLERILKFKKYISRKRAVKVDHYKFENDKKLSILGELLIRYAICLNCNVINSEIKFKENRYGKLFIESIEDVFFNLSHSGSYVICGISDQKIGIDIEEIKDIDLSIASEFFCKSENDLILSAHGSDKIEYFYSIWCLKESYIKYEGRGLHIALDSFCFSIAGKTIKLIDSSNFKDINFEMLPIDSNYKSAVCYNGSSIHSIEKVHIDDILKVLKLYLTL